MSDPGRAVFLSYASQDAEAAQQLCNALRGAGVEVWFDRSELRGGDAWDALIRRQIKVCYLFVPIISTNTQSREEGYFRREWNLAVARTLDMAEGRAFLLPIVIDATTDAQAMVPEKFREVQWTRLPAGANPDAFVERVRRLLSADTVAPIAASVRSPAPPTSPMGDSRSRLRHSRAFVPWIAAGLLILVMSYFVVDTFVLPKRPLPVAQAPVTAPAFNPPAHSIAVLPFTNMSSDKEQDYFSDGISEDLLNLLTKIPQLQVTARTSSFSFKGKDIAIPEIARTLGVAHVLEGSVRKAGDAVRITAQLIDAASDTQLWSQSYDRKLDDIFKIQDEIAADVVKNLRVKLLGAAPTTRTTDPQAYAFYLQAKQLGEQYSAEAFKQSDALYRKALAIDPRYTPAWTRLSENLYHETGQGLLPTKEGFAQARDAAMNALAIDPDYAPAHAGLGLIAMSGDKDLVGAAEHLKRALALDPADPDVLRTSADLLASLGRLHEALALDEAIVRRDPVNVYALFNLGYHQRMDGLLDAAIATSQTVLNLAPGRGGAHTQIGLALLLKGDAQEALAEIEQETRAPIKMIALPMAYYALGRKADSNVAIEELIANHTADAPYNIAYVYAYRGEADRAFEWLDKAVEYSDPGLGDIVVENLFDTIHADPRWLAFLRKIGKAPEQLAKIEFEVTLPEPNASLPADATQPAH